MWKGYIFDLDGVITATARWHFAAWKAEMARHGINFTKYQNSRLKGLSRLDTLKAILKIHHAEARFSTTELTAIANAKNRKYQALLATKVSEQNILPGVQTFLAAIAAQGGKMAIASSSYNAPLILKKVALFDYFTFIVNPADVKHGKPAPDIYLQAAAGLNLKPHECIGFEDAIAGVSGLKAAQITTVAITWGVKEAWQEADYVLNSTAELDLAKFC